jgi:acyl-CoA thioesterase I
MIGRIVRRVLLSCCLALFAAAAHAEIKIVALGHSLFASEAGPTKEGYPEQLQAALKAKGYDVVVSNAGLWADTTTGVLKRLDKAVAVGTQIVILAIGINDYRYGVRPSEVDANIDKIVAQLRAKGAEVIVSRWRDPPGKYVDEGGTNPVVERLPDRTVIPWLARGVPQELKAMGGHPMGAGNAIIVAWTLPIIEEIIAKVKQKQ